MTYVQLTLLKWFSVYSERTATTTSVHKPLRLFITPKREPGP